VRCFVAVELASAVRKPLLRLLRELPRSREVRWCGEEQLHVTLKFLGEVSDVKRDRVCEVMADTSGQIQPFAIRVGGLGCFPSPRSPRVLWCGVEDRSDGCARWVKLADPLLAELGFEPEARAFTPHVTLGRSRSRNGGAALQRVLETSALAPGVEMEVGEVVLFESRLLPQGAQYRLIQRVPLGGGR
jgi:2'-5' RNA ligase